MSDNTRTNDNPNAVGSELLPPICSDSDLNAAIEYARKYCSNVSKSSPKYKKNCWLLGAEVLRQRVEIAMLKIKVFNLQNAKGRDGEAIP